MAVKISELPPAPSAIQPGDEVPVVRGSDTYRIDLTDQFAKAIAVPGPFTTEEEADADPPTNWETIYTWDIGPNPSVGTYELTFQFRWNLTDTVKMGLFRGVFAGEDVDLFAVEPKDSTNKYLQYGRHFIVFTDVAPRSFSLQFLISSGGGTDTLTVRDLTMSIERKSSDTSL